MPNESASHTDVRMRGFSSRTLVEEAWKWVEVQSRLMEGEAVAYDAAHGRVLSADIVSHTDVPAFDRSAMDGFALRSAQTVGAGEYNPLVFDVLGESLPGKPFSGEVTPGTAVRIMTGAPLPSGADAVVPAEYARQEGDRVEITQPVPASKHVGRRGEDVTSGSTLLEAGRQLRPQDIGLVASIGVSHVDVVRRPRVRLLVTGNELVQPGETRGTHQIYDSNSSMLKGLIARDGGELESHQYLEDKPEALSSALTAPGADVILISGGSSVGREDHAPAVLAEQGELAIHGIAMRPSSPTGLGKVAQSLVVLLPGNPVSCLCAYDFFAGRALRSMGGRNADWPYERREGTLNKKIVSAVGRVDYCRVAVHQADESIACSIEPLALSGASILSSTSRADGFVIVPAALEGYAPGNQVEVYLYAAHG